jgi:hypothetical protein
MEDFGKKIGDHKAKIFDDEFGQQTADAGGLYLDDVNDTLYRIERKKLW